jgi:type IV secretory pathway TrbD component
MQQNIGIQDRMVRIIFGLAFVGLAFYWRCWFSAAVGLVLLLTAAIGWCGLYQLFKISTCRIKK